jgi:hypothetical protein
MEIIKLSVPWLPFGLHGLALRPFVFYKRGHESIIKHEMIHIAQQKSFGLMRYCWKYVFNKDFRYQMEFEAYFKGSGLSMQEASIRAKAYLIW